MSQPVQRRSQRTAPVSAGKCGNALARGAEPPGGRGVLSGSSPWGAQAPSVGLQIGSVPCIRSLDATPHSKDGRIRKPGTLSPQLTYERPFMSSSVYFKFPYTLPSKKGGSWSQNQAGLINSGLIIYIRAGRPLISHVGFLKFAFLEVSIWNIRLDFLKPLLFDILRLGSQARKMLSTRFHLWYLWMLNSALQNVLKFRKLERAVLKTGARHAMPNAGLRNPEGVSGPRPCETTLTP